MWFLEEYDRVDCVSSDCGTWRRRDWSPLFDNCLRYQYSENSRKGIVISTIVSHFSSWHTEGSVSPPVQPSGRFSVEFSLSKFPYSPSLCIFLILLVEMGLLGHGTSECYFPDPSHLLPSPQTCDRIIQIETQENRFFRKFPFADGYGIHSGSHLEWGFNIRLDVSRGHRPSCPGRRYSCRLRFG